jgi:hypothetical protein
MLRPASGVSAQGTRRTSKPAPLIDRRHNLQEKEVWTFLSNHFHVLIALTMEPSRSLREVALLVGITERSTQRIVADLERDGYLERERVGRNNHYKIRSDLPLRHSLERGCSVADVLNIILAKNPPDR